ncbi:hypothetical protein B0A48_07186 [Cryoendolithus antarcticus]|uniref:Uncharacterized protein n=1 Tax=Cryoendolithus antarcticus TaxID=1507870 RepID=A0A1V8T828_9PEZI|nr:hypothetical protein B0A48_07186 [Cryoendolithus antarcticus]
MSSNSLSRGIWRHFQTNKTAAVEACPLFALPTEVYDKILAYPFPPVPRLKLLFSRDWDTMEKEKQQTSPPYNVRPTPAPEVNEWLVSKRFFHDAAKTWFAAQTFDFCMRCERKPRPETLRVVLKYSSFADVPSAMIPRLLICRSLKHVGIELRPEDFELVDGGRCGWKDCLTETEVDVIRVNTGLSTLPRFASLEIYQPEDSDVRWPSGLNDLQRQLLLLPTNVYRLQALTRQRAATKSAIPESAWSYAPRPMCMGSKVYMANANPLLPAYVRLGSVRSFLRITGIILQVFGLTMLLIKVVDLSVGEQILPGLFKLLI